MRNSLFAPTPKRGWLWFILAAGQLGFFAWFLFSFGSHPGIYMYLGWAVFWAILAIAEFVPAQQKRLVLVLRIAALLFIIIASVILVQLIDKESQDMIQHLHQ